MAGAGGLVELPLSLHDFKRLLKRQSEEQERRMQQALQEQEKRLREEQELRLQEAMKEEQELRKQAIQEALQEERRMVMPSSDGLHRFMVYDGNASSRASTTSKEGGFKNKLIDFYDVEVGLVSGTEKRSLRCMILDMMLPSSLVIGGHIFKREWFKFDVHKTLLNMEDIDCARNGFLLFKPVEWAFDRSMLFFDLDSTSGDFFLRILDPSIRSRQLMDVLLSDVASEPGRPKFRIPPEDIMEATKLVVGETTFGCLERRRLKYRSMVNYPLKRALSFHARMAIDLAEKRGWVEPGSILFMDYSSETGQLAKRRLERWMDDQAVPLSTSYDFSEE